MTKQTLRYRRIGITVKSGLSRKNDLVGRLAATAQGCGAEVFLDAERCKGLPSAASMRPLEPLKDIDLLIVIGGDGSILRAVRELPDFSVPILSVNGGAVGFLSETTVDEAEELLPGFLAGKGVIEERNLLSVEVERAGKVIRAGRVLNEAVIAQGAIARLLYLRTSVNGEPLATFHADGLIVATPTGSTAYSLAAGGPIVHPSLSAAILTPLNPHSFSQKPLVIPGHLKIEVEVMPKSKTSVDAEMSLTLDGQTYVTLERHDRIRAHMNDKTVKFLRRTQETFFSTLRSKLKWGENLDRG